jgi:hypothetical protein
MKTWQYGAKKKIAGHLYSLSLADACLTDYFGKFSEKLHERYVSTRHILSIYRNEGLWLAAIG